MKRVNIMRADPAGNTTVFVLSNVEDSERAVLAAKIMSLPDLGAEQVAFAHPAPEDTDGAFVMMGGEFCGNASRAYGMVLARLRGETGRLCKRLQVSGCVSPITVTVDTDKGTAEAEMPLPKTVETVSVCGVRGTLVHLGGIAHLVVEDVTPSTVFFADAEQIFTTLGGIDAYGICFVKGNTLTPLVKVPATDTLVFEGSCGSGSLAAAVAMSREKPDGIYRFCYTQPAGIVEASVTREDGGIAAASIGGSVTVDAPMEIEI